MKKYFLVISCYSDWRQEHFLKYHSPRNQAYCNHHGYEYIEITDVNEIYESCKTRVDFTPEHYLRNIVWWRFFLIQHWIKTGFLQKGDIISQIDADALIVDGTIPFEPLEGKSFAYVIDSCNTHCMGVHSLRINEWVIQMLKNLLSEERYQKFKNNPFWKVFAEQASWYSLAGIKDTFADPNQIPWTRIPNLGWQSTTDNEPLYSLEELYEHVEIKPVEWNVTVWNTPNPYFKIPMKSKNREDVRIRHFCGRTWETDWLEIPLIKK
jgi:hypothetical protein